MAAIRSQARSSWSVVLVLSLLTHSALATGQPLAGGNPPVDVTRQTLFSIPFYLTPNAPPPTEIHLYVSGDRGQTWSLYQRRQPQQSKFDFQAGKDGEYWFIVRTNEDRKMPSPTTRPEKIVLVDRANPALQVDVSFGATGELIAHYLASDANLDPSSLRLEYRAGENEPWQPIPVDRHQDGEKSASSSLDGTASWAVVEAPGVIRIRGDVSDRAGNRGTFEEAVDLNQMSTNLSSRTASPANSPSGAAPPSRTTLTSDPPSIDTPALPWLATDANADKRESPTGWRKLDAGWPAEPQESTGVGAPIDPGATSQLNVVPQNAAKPTVTNSNDHAVDDRFSDDYAPPVANRVATTAAAQRPDVQMTNSRRFNLDYEVAGNGSTGVARVELWVSLDNGNTWQPFGLDRDLQSPFLVELDQEGTYGFRLLIHLQDGISARPPQPGDAPDLTIGLDWTPPRAQLLTASVAEPAKGASSTGTTLDITWQAEDNFLVERPIRMSYAPSADGPWSLVTADLPNTGSYRWEHDQPLPARTYLKLEVRDQAGNITTDLLAEPVGAGGGGPRGILRGIRPVAEASRPQAGS